MRPNSRRRQAISVLLLVVAIMALTMSGAACHLFGDSHGSSHARLVSVAAEHSAAAAGTVELSGHPHSHDCPTDGADCLLQHAVSQTSAAPATYLLMVMAAVIIAVVLHRPHVILGLRGPPPHSGARDGRAILTHFCISRR